MLAERLDRSGCGPDGAEREEHRARAQHRCRRSANRPVVPGDDERRALDRHAGQRPSIPPCRRPSRAGPAQHDEEQREPRADDEQARGSRGRRVHRVIIVPPPRTANGPPRVRTRRRCERTMDDPLVVTYVVRAAGDTIDARADALLLEQTVELPRSALHDRGARSTRSDAWPASIPSPGECVPRHSRAAGRHRRRRSGAAAERALRQFLSAARHRARGRGPAGRTRAAFSAGRGSALPGSVPRSP